MRIIQGLLVSAALAAAAGAQASVATSVSTTSGSFLTLSSTPTGGTVGPYTIVGGTVYNTDKPFASDPDEAGYPIFGGTFLAAGPLAGTPSSISFGSGIGYISFLWGSPDTYNMLTVTGTGGYSHTFTAAEVNIGSTTGDQSYARYVGFTGTAGTLITSLTFFNLPSTDAFEAANFSLTAPVPEPQTYAMMVAGLVAIGWGVSRRQRH
jgi:hypothetical protein